MPEHVATAISLVIGIVLCISVWKIRREFLLDRFREDMFTLREEMFLYAARNGLLQHPAYRELREIINGLVRFGHRLSLYSMFSKIFAAKIAKFEIPRQALFGRWETAIAALPEEQAIMFRNIHAKEMVIVIRYMVSRPVILWELLNVVLYIRRKMETKRPSDQEFVNVVGPNNLRMLENEAICYLS